MNVLKSRKSAKPLPEKKSKQSANHESTKIEVSALKAMLGKASDLENKTIDGNTKKKKNKRIR